MQYTEAVSEARQLVKRSEADQRRLAELTWEQVDAGVTMTKWAEDVGVSQPYVSWLVRIWEKYSQVIERPKFADAYATVKGMPTDRTERRQAEATATVRNMPAEKKAAVVREALEDPEVAVHVAAGAPASPARHAHRRLHDSRGAGEARRPLGAARGGAGLGRSARARSRCSRCDRGGRGRNSNSRLRQFWIARTSTR